MPVKIARPLKRLFGIALAVALTPVVTPTAANAAAAATEYCTTGYFCIYEHSGFVGRFWAYPQSRNVDSIGDFMNNRMTGFKNFTNMYACLYEEPNYQHKLTPNGLGFIPPGYWVSTVNPFANDKLSSIRFRKGYEQC